MGNKITECLVRHGNVWLDDGMVKVLDFYGNERLIGYMEDLREEEKSLLQHLERKKTG